MNHRPSASDHRRSPSASATSGSRSGVRHSIRRADATASSPGPTPWRCSVQSSRRTSIPRSRSTCSASSEVGPPGRSSDQNRIHRSFIHARGWFAVISITTRRRACPPRARANPGRSGALYTTWWHTTTSAGSTEPASSGHDPCTARCSTPAAVASSSNAASILSDWSKAVRTPARGRSARDAAPAPDPTSSTDPPFGSASSARPAETDAAASSAERSARRRNGSTGNPHGDSGARSRISSGMAQAASCSTQPSAAVAIAGLV